MIVRNVRAIVVEFRVRELVTAAEERGLSHMRAERPRTPPQLRRLLDVLSRQDKLRKFHGAYGRDPANEEELDASILDLAVGLYNDDWDEWPENDGEVERRG